MFMVYAYAVNEAFTIGVFESKQKVEAALDELVSISPELFSHYFIKVDVVTIDNIYGIEHAEQYNSTIG